MSVHPIQAQSKPQAPSTVRYKSFAHIILITINLGLSNLYFGYSLVYISTIEFKEIIRLYSITMGAQTARGILTGCIPVGAGIGALLGRKLIHVFSRRYFVLLINTIAIIAGSVIFIDDMVVFIVMRLIQGICVGMYTAIIPLYINEISPVEIQSSTAPFTQIFCSCGTTIAYLFYYILSVTVDSKDTVWYLVLGFPLIPLIIQTLILLFVFPYQTPKFLLIRHHKKRAHQLIAQIYKPEFVDAVFRQKIQDLQEAKGKNDSKTKNQVKPGQPTGFVPPIHLESEASISSGQLSGVEIKQPLTPGIAIFTAIHLMILRQFSGINAVVAYGGDIINKAAPSLRSIVPVFLNFEIMLGALAAICILHRVGKKTLLQAGTTVLALALLIIAIGFFIVDSQYNAAFVMILLGLIVFTFTFGLTYGAIIWAYVSQIVEPSYDILATMITWVFASIVIILFPILKSSVMNGNPSYLFLFFCVWLVVSFFINQIVMVQTRNKTEHQIREQYMEVKCQCICRKKEVKSIQLPPQQPGSLINFNEIGRDQVSLGQLKNQQTNNKNEETVK